MRVSINRGTPMYGNPHSGSLTNRYTIYGSSINKIPGLVNIEKAIEHGHRNS